MGKSQRAWTADQDAYLATHYANTPMTTLADVLGHTIIGIRRRARFLDLLRARTIATQAIHHDYFSALDTPLKAYIVGLLAADGTVSSDEPRIRLKLHVKDACLVEMVREELAPYTPLQRRAAAIEFAVSSPQLVADLARFGVVPRKSYCLKWPGKIPVLLHHAFLLGYFDGDGSLTMAPTRAGNTSLAWTLYGFPGFLSAASDVIAAQAGVHVAGPDPDRRKDTLHRIRAFGRHARTLDEWLHHDGLGLARKRIPV
jgi:hypothetical protein